MTNTSAVPQFSAKENTAMLRKALGMKAYNSKRSKFSFETFMQFANDNIGFIAKSRDGNDLYYVEAMIMALAMNYARGILDTDLSMVLRSLNGWQTSALIGKLAADCRTIDDSIIWLKANRESIING